MESVFPEPQSSKWESGKGTDAGESASSHVHHTLSFPTANDRKKRDYGKYDFESKNICTSGTHTAHRVRREYLHLRYLCSHDRVKKQREEWRINYFDQANHFFFFQVRVTLRSLYSSRICVLSSTCPGLQETVRLGS